MENLVFLRPAETEAGDTNLSPVGALNVEHIVRNLRRQVPTLGTIVVVSSYEARAILTGAEVTHCLVGESVFVAEPRYELGDEVGRTMNDTDTWAMLRSIAESWDTIIVVSHRKLVESFPAYWMREELGVAQPPKFKPDNSQGIFIRIQIREAKII